MICRLLTLPFWLLSRLTSLVVGILKLALSLVMGILAFVLNHLIGTVIGALAGLLLGRRHVGVKIFTHKKAIPVGVK